MMEFNTLSPEQKQAFIDHLVTSVGYPRLIEMILKTAKTEQRKDLGNYGQEHCYSLWSRRWVSAFNYVHNYVSNVARENQSERCDGTKLA
jgi:hypothetical protein